MKKASEVLLLVAKILSFIAGGCLIVTSIFFYVFGADYFKELVVQGSNSPDPAVDGIIYQVTLISFGVIFDIWGCLFFVNGAIANLALKEPTRKNMILNIVFGALTCLEVNLAGAIFGLIAINKQESQQSTLE